MALDSQARGAIFLWLVVIPFLFLGTSAIVCLIAMSCLGLL